MSVQITDSEHVALYDSVSDTAFGPIWDSEEEATEFLKWYDESDYQQDLRELLPVSLAELQEEFRNLDEEAEDEAEEEAE